MKKIGCLCVCVRVKGQKNIIGNRVKETWSWTDGLEIPASKFELARIAVKQMRTRDGQVKSSQVKTIDLFFAIYVSDSCLK